MPEAPRPRRPRMLPPHVLSELQDTAPELSEAALVDRLEQALAGLPDLERAAVVASVGYAEGPVGAAMEVELDPEQAEALTRNALQLLRAAMVIPEP